MGIYESGVLITKATVRKGLFTPNPAPTMSSRNTLGMSYPNRGQMAGDGILRRTPSSPPVLSSHSVGPNSD